MAEYLAIAAYCHPSTITCFRKPIVILWISQIQSWEVCFMQQAQEVNSRSNSTRLKVLWMDLHVSQDNQDFPFHIIYPSVTPSTLIPVAHIHTVELLVLDQASLPRGSFLIFLSWGLLLYGLWNHVPFLQNTYHGLYV